MSINRVISEVRRHLWTLEPGYFETMAGVLNRHQRGESASPDDWARMVAARDTTTARRAASARAGGGSIAVIPVCGVLTQRAGLITDYSGGTSYQALSSQLREAVADSSIGQILLDIDSPGGSVAGCQELVAEIFQMRNQKPIIGISNAQAASAAYWIGTACTELYCSPSAEVGSIGVYSGHEDQSAALDQAGVKVTLISAGKYKTEGSPFSALTTDAKNHMQSRVDECYQAFTASVAKGRGVPIDTVRKGMGEGRCLGADAALANGMIDGIAPLSALIGDLQTNPRRAGMKAKFGATAARASARVREVEILSLGLPPGKTPAEFLARAAARRREIEILSK